MVIGFLILRITFLKTLGKLIEASLLAGHTVFLFYDENEVLPGKEYQRVNRQKLSWFEAKGARLMDFSLERLGGLAGRGIDVLAVHEGYYVLNKHLDAVKALRNSGIIFISLPHFFENVRVPIEAVHDFDKTIYVSDFALDTHLEITHTAKQEVEDSSWVMGSPLFDQFENLDKAVLRNKFNVPAGKKVVLFFCTCHIRRDPLEVLHLGAKHLVGKTETCGAQRPLGVLIGCIVFSVS
jgi:hypothetical protein